MSEPLASLEARSGLQDFDLDYEDRREVDLDWLLGQNNLTLYTLDFAASCVVFAVTPQFRNLYVHPSLADAQRKLADRVCVVPFSQVKELANKARLKVANRGAEPNVFMLYSTGQCGSTILAHFFERVRNPQINFYLHASFCYRPLLNLVLLIIIYYFSSSFCSHSGQLPGILTVVEPAFLSQFALILQKPHGLCSV